MKKEKQINCHSRMFLSGISTLYPSPVAAEGRGFTLVELLIAVVIIGVLVAVAVPQYQKAVLKSRFSAVIPATKTIAQAQEFQYLHEGSYARNLEDLDVKLSNSRGSVTVSDSSEYKYVMGIPEGTENNHYIMYQKHSPNYPDEIHCEALSGNSLAEWVCQSFGAMQSIGETISSGFVTYLLSGTGNGLPPSAGEALNSMNCDKAIEMGLTCSMSEDGRTKKVCTTINETTKVCRYRTDNEDGGYTLATCQADSEGVCTTTNVYMYTRDANGNQTRQRYCKTLAADGSCSEYNTSGNNDYTYDADGKIMSTRYCKTVAADGNCSEYSSGMDITYDANGNRTRDRDCKTFEADGSCSEYSSGTDYTYDANGNKTRSRSCKTVAADGSCGVYTSGTDYTYDANGNQTSARSCKTVAADGSCSEYNTYSNFDYTYDANGNKTSELQCNMVAANGSCSEYNTYGNYYYTYDANGNKTSYRSCKTVAANGSCSAYSSGEDYTYDANGNRTRYLTCKTLAADGSCSEYRYGYYYTYDANGKELRSLPCSTVAADGSCSAYGNVYGSSGVYYTYDTNGNMTSRRYCQTLTSDGTCSQYQSGTYFVYDDDGKQIATKTCSAENFTANGECLSYSGSVYNQTW